MYVQYILDEMGNLFQEIIISFFIHELLIYAFFASQKAVQDWIWILVLKGWSLDSRAGFTVKACGLFLAGFHGLGLESVGLSTMSVHKFT